VATPAADNIMTALGRATTLLVPRTLQRLRPRRLVNPTTQTADELSTQDEETVSPRHLAVLLAMGTGAIYLSKQVSAIWPVIPFVLMLTTIALVLAQFRLVNRLRGSRLLGLLGIYLFLAVIGAYCDLSALLKDGQLAIVLFGMICTIVLIHAVIIYGVGALFKQDWDMLGIASQANIGGATSALALARSLNRPDLQLSAVLVGSLGSAIGTYLGILVAEALH
jgi:uncharacterized membrane protein